MRVYLLFLLVARISFGQSDSIPASKLIVKFAPLSLIPAYMGPSIRAGVEYRFKNPWAIYGELGSFFYNSKGLTGKLELKFYFSETVFKKPARAVSNYFSTELYYKYQYYDTYDSIAPDLMDGEPGFPKTEYSVSKHIECFTIKYGALNVFNSGFVLDAFIGLGIRFKQAKNTLSPEDNVNMPSTSDYGPNLFINRAGNFIYPNFEAGIKIGWRIKSIQN